MQAAPVRVTERLLTSLFPATPSDSLRDWVAPLNTACERFYISKPLRLAGFLAQVGHESGGLRVMVENLNYSATGLRRVFGRYFQNDTNAITCARQPEKIAGLVYANRMGNGPVSTGDGWRFRGRGLIQLTGRDNYARFARFMGLTVEAVIPFLETKDGAAMSAGWFWDTNGLNAYADRDDVVGMTKRVNGGTNGLAERNGLYERAKRLLTA